MKKTNNFLRFIIGLLVVASMTSCDDEFQKNELDLKGKVEASCMELSGTYAKIKIKTSGIFNFSLGISDSKKDNIKLYYGTSENPIEMTEYADAYTIKDGSLIGGGIGFTLPNLKPSTTYYIALKVDTIYTQYVTLDCPNPLHVATSPTSGFVIPDGVNSFMTLNNEVKAVDLGLSVLWAETDLGTTDDWHTPTYSWANDEIRGMPPLMNITGTEYDPVTAILGEGWRMPTADEYKELMEKTSITHRIDNEHGGYILCRNLDNGKYIKLYSNSGRYSDNWEGERWTSNVYEAINNSFYVTVFTFSSTGVEMKKSLYNKSKQYPIRPVHEK